MLTCLYQRQVIGSSIQIVIRNRYTMDTANHRWIKPIRINPNDTLREREWQKMDTNGSDSGRIIYYFIVRDGDIPWPIHINCCAMINCAVIIGQRVSMSGNVGWSTLIIGYVCLMSDI